MSVALLAISSFGTLILLSCNTDPSVKFLIVIILVVQEIHRNSGEWRFEGGGGKVVSGSTEFCTSSSCPEAIVPCSGRISWNTSSWFLLFFSLSKLLIGFFLVNLAGHVEMH